MKKKKKKKKTPFDLETALAGGSQPTEETNGKTFNYYYLVNSTWT